jgi:hypothetical protein
MTPQERNWMETVLDVRPPWQVQGVRLDPQERLVAVQIGPQAESSGPFWAPRRSVAPSRRLHWTHLALAGQRCEVTLALRDGQRVPEAPWAGDPEQPFTHALARLVLDLMLDGATMSQLCRLQGLQLSELWKYKYRLDHGNARAPQPLATTPATAPQPLAAPAPSASAHQVPPAAVAVPPEDAAVWMALLSGRLPLAAQALGLKLLLSKLVREAATHHDADLHRQAAESLHRYFVRNQALLGPEIAELQRAERALRDAETQRQAQTAARLNQQGDDSAVPDVSDPLWQALLSGEVALDVRTLSLRLMLSKLRLQASSLKDDEVRMLKLVELHRFFEKHQAVLHHELAQIGRAHV